jgi:hypothetical protein
MGAEKEKKPKGNPEKKKGGKEEREKNQRRGRGW